MVHWLAKGHTARDRAKLETRSSHSKLNMLSHSFHPERDMGNRSSLLLNYLALFNSLPIAGRENPRRPMTSTPPAFRCLWNPKPLCWVQTHISNCSLSFSSQAVPGATWTHPRAIWGPWVFPQTCSCSCIFYFSKGITTHSVSRARNPEPSQNPLSPLAPWIVMKSCPFCFLMPLHYVITS